MRKFIFLATTMFFVLAACSPKVTSSKTNEKPTEESTQTDNVINSSKVSTTENQMVQAPVSGDYSITVQLNDVAEGETIHLVNGTNGQVEQTGTFKDHQVKFSGTIDQPDFKVLVFDLQQGPYLTIFIDNSQIKVDGSKADFMNAQVNGSASHNDFKKYNQVIQQHNSVLGDTPTSSDLKEFESGLNALKKFIDENSKSLIAPLAIIKYNQLTGDEVELKSMASKMNVYAKNGRFGQYINQLVEMGKSSPVGTKMMDFVQEDVSGKKVRLSSFKGKYVLVDFWASWCGPCRRENPNLVKTYNHFKSKNFTVLGVSLDRDRDAWLKAITDDNLTWTQVSDLKFWQNEVAVQFNIQSIPQNFLIDPNGVIIGKNLRGMALDYRLMKAIK